MKYPKLRIKILKDLAGNPRESYSYKISKRLNTDPASVCSEIKNMREEGLIYIYLEKKHPNPKQKIKYYKLTLDGKKLARLYFEIDQIYLNL